MVNQELRNIDDYEVFLTEKLTSWSSDQGVALIAAIAEHWYPAYESLSVQEKWGDPASFRRSLDSVWSHIQGRRLTKSSIAQQVQQIHEITPHMDDFEAPEALIACISLMDALKTSGETKQTIACVVHSATSVFEGLVDEWPIDPKGEERVWKQGVVRKELQTQLKLIEEIESISDFNEESVKQLRNRIAHFKVKPPQRPKTKAPSQLTNQTLFEQYRRMVESDLKSQARGQVELLDNSYLFALTFLGYWSGRYSRRLQTINGSYGRWADELGQQALIARNRARDATETGDLEWDREVYEVIEMCLKNNSLLKVLDADSVESPHAYGPSIRRLWLEGKRFGLSNREAWNPIRTWASHRPPSWEIEDRRKKKGLAHSSAELGEKLAKELSWVSTNDPFLPWTTTVEGKIWQIRINDFPDELLYSLLIDNENSGDFHDWPDSWQRTNLSK